MVFQRPWRIARMSPAGPPQELISHLSGNYGAQFGIILVCSSCRPLSNFVQPFAVSLFSVQTELRRVTAFLENGLRNKLRFGKLEKAIGYRFMKFYVEFQKSVIVLVVVFAIGQVRVGFVLIAITESTWQFFFSKKKKKKWIF